MTKKEFALAQIAPYFKDPRTCGLNETAPSCMYLTPDGRMCVAGKNMLDPSKWKSNAISIFGILEIYTQSEIFKPEVVDILTTEEWNKLQQIHDELAFNNNPVLLNEAINELNLFTPNELNEYTKTI